MLQAFQAGQQSFASPCSRVHLTRVSEVEAESDRLTETD